MRICVLVHNAVANDGRVIRQADALAGAGHQVTVLGVRNPGSPPEPPGVERPWGLRLYQRDRVGWRGRRNWLITALRSRAAERLARLSGARFGAAHAVVRALPELTRMAAREDADLYIANDLTTLPAACAAARRRGARVIYDAHDLYTDEDAEKAPYWTPIIASVERRWIRETDAVITVSPGCADALAELYGVRAVVVRNVPPLEWSAAVDQSSPGAARPPGRLALLHQGVLGFRSRGLEDLLEAWPGLLEGVELHVRGFVTPDAAEALDALARRHPGRVFRHPVVEPWRLLLEGSRCDVGLVLTKATSRSNLLSLPNKLFEYMHSRLAIIATALPGPADVLAETGAGITYEPGDVAALRDGINRLAADPALLERYRANARQAALERYHWERERTALLDLVAKVGAAPRERGRRARPLQTQAAP
jgi:glycogen synthase